MSDIQSYPVNFEYGATSAPYSAARPHRGRDRAAPTGTSITIGSTIIGLVGMTGWATGPHLHTQAGTDIGCQNTFNPSSVEFEPGTVVNIGWGDQWGNFVTMQVGSNYVTYCHLSKISVTRGQVIKGGSMALTATQVIAEYRTNRGPNGKAPTATEITLHSTKGTYESLSQGFRPENDARFKAQATEVAGLNTTIKAKDVEIAKLKATITVKDAEIAKLKAELAKPPVAGGFTDTDRQTLGAISSTVTWIKDKLTNVFK